MKAPPFWNPRLCGDHILAKSEKYKVSHITRLELDTKLYKIGSLCSICLQGVAIFIFRLSTCYYYTWNYATPSIVSAKRNSICRGVNCYTFSNEANKYYGRQDGLSNLCGLCKMKITFIMLYYIMTWLKVLISGLVLMLSTRQATTGQKCNTFGKQMSKYWHFVTMFGITISTNMPGIGSLIREIDVRISEIWKGKKTYNLCPRSKCFKK